MIILVSVSALGPWVGKSIVMFFFVIFIKTGRGTHRQVTCIIVKSNYILVKYFMWQQGKNPTQTHILTYIAVYRTQHMPVY